MKIFLKYSAAIILMIGGSHKAIAADPLVLSREQCVEIALRDNPTVRIADMEVKKYDYSKKEVLASLFPSIDFSAAYQRSIELQTIRMNMGARART